jgi:uncharacterized membrane protein YhiD involved in acid resistance
LVEKKQESVVQMKSFRGFAPAAVLALASAAAEAQSLSDLVANQPLPAANGWLSFTDVGFLINMVITLALSAVLGALIGYHPRHVQLANTLEEIEAPKVHILYAVIGAVIGILVLKYGLVVGFVVFGIGGLIRFRTVLRSAGLTGNVILVTLIGLSCGLNMPHVAVLATAFGFGLIYLLEAAVAYRIDIKSVPSGRVADATAAYRALLEQEGCRIVGEKKSPTKSKVILIFKCRHSITRDHLEELLETRIDPALKGSVDWEVD